MPMMFPVLATTVPADTDPGGMLAIVILVLLAAYAFACVFWPYGLSPLQGSPGKVPIIIGWLRPACQPPAAKAKAGV